MQLPLDRDSPVPLYHQLAEALRWRISTGRLSAGERLPTVRAAAGELGVNMHTVRRAYAALAEEGMVESTSGRGTFVLGQGTVDSTTVTEPGDDELERFVATAARTARECFGLGPEELARLLVAHSQIDAPRAMPVVHVLECSESQCRDHAEEIMAVWAVDVRPWSLPRSGEPPPGPLVATYFHYAEIQRRWPQRRGDLCFLPIHVDPALPHRLSSGGRLEACELDEDKARNLQADLEALFPAGALPVVPRVVTDPAAALESARGDSLLCFSPRAWAQLSRDQRRHPRVRKVRYLIEAEALDALGRQLGWDRPSAA